MPTQGKEGKEFQATNKLMNEDMPLDCPECGAEMPAIGCEKTTVCPNCSIEWKWALGMKELEPVLKDDASAMGVDPIYWDR